MTDRYLVLVRHAKAEHPDGVADIDRPLTPRGHGDAAAAGAWLAHRRLAPDLVLCSPAKRTRQTWHGIALGMAESAAAGGNGAVGGGMDVRYDPVAYAGDAQDLLERLRAVDEETRMVLLVGHNPAISLLSAALDPATEPDGLRTCGIAVHRPTGTWRESGSGTAVLEAVHTARG
ncbi:MAG TPA: histidine phosphatase family protein [Micromonosporaceae bacterium]|nr:histidine phosphatase family protein [Micromonosporaceae bacterium]